MQLKDYHAKYYAHELTKRCPWDSVEYRDLASFQTATLIYDATYFFCEKFLDPRSRTVDQMVQAARSGRQNIAEGSRAAATSSQTELRLVNVARSSQEELLLDYEDFLRHRRLPQWPPDSPEASAVRSVPRRFKQDRTDPTDLKHLTDLERWALYAPWLEHEDPAVRGNAVICLIHQVNFLLDQQIEALERDFVEGGGYSEQLAAARLAERGRRKRGDRSDPSDPTDQIPDCPQCGKTMALRTAKAGKHTPARSSGAARGIPTAAAAYHWRGSTHEHRGPERTCHPKPGDQAVPGVT